MLEILTDDDFMEIYEYLKNRLNLNMNMYSMKIEFKMDRDLRVEIMQSENFKTNYLQLYFKEEVGKEIYKFLKEKIIFPPSTSYMYLFLNHDKTIDIKAHFVAIKKPK